MIAFDPIATPIATGITLVEASAGTGKTWCLSRLVVRLLLERPDLPPSQVLVVTFTNAATAELATRIRDVLKKCHDGCADDDIVRLRALGTPARIAECLLNSDDLAVCTIHAFCKRALEQSAFSGGEPFSSELLTDASALRGEVVRDVWRSRLHGDAALAAIAVAGGWKIDDDLKLVRSVESHRDLRVEPAEADLDTAIRQVVDAVAAVAALRSDDSLDALLVGATWNKGYSAWAEPGTCARLRAALPDDVATLSATWETLGIFAELEKGITKRSKVGKECAARVAAHPLVRACQALLAACDAVRIAWRVHLVAARARAEQLKRQRQQWSQDDLLHRLDAALCARPELEKDLRTRYALALIDEFQDTDPVQCAIFARLFGDRTLLLIGDPKQSIYRFRGADLNAYLGMARHAAARHTLGTNHRSAAELVAAVNALFSQTDQPFATPGITFTPVAAAGARQRLVDAPDTQALHWWLMQDSDDRDGAVVAEMLRLFAHARMATEDGERPLRPADCAVLVRSHRQAQSLRERLAACGIPAVVAAGGDVLKRDEARELAVLCAAVLAPHDGRAVRAALATTLWGEDAAGIAALAQDATRWQALVTDFAAWNRLWQRHGLAAMAERIFAARGTWQRLAACGDGERRLTDLRHVVELAQRRQAEEHLTPGALAQWLAAHQAEDGGKERELRLDSDSAAVALVTVHGAKGLEYPVVFCPWLGKPSSRREAVVLAHDADGRLVLDLGSHQQGEREQAAWREDLAEDLRLAYVALTRARLRCYVAWGPVKDADHWRSGLGWLLRPQGLDLDAWQALLADKEQAKALDAWAPLRALVDAHATCMSCAPPPAAAGRWSGPQLDTSAWRARVLPDEARQRLRPWVVTSYSRLVQTRHEDDDEVAMPMQADLAGAPLQSGLAGFARGRDAGSCLHAILERWDLSPVVVETLVTTQLARFALGAGSTRHAPGCEPLAAVQELCARLAVTPLPDADHALANVAADRRFAEWEFHLPLAGLSGAAVAEDLRHEDAEAYAHCGAALARLDGRLAQGFLTGSVDLVWEHAGRWWLADWKSNHLGGQRAAYARAALWRPMAEGHYLLQCLCYVLALHRYLRTRLADYDYDRHVGGAFYVFLRGIDGDAGQGILPYRPSRGLIERLERRLVPIVLEVG